MSASTVRNLFNYNPETGVFTWIVSRGRVQAGATAGFVIDKKTGRRGLVIDGRNIPAARVAWVWVIGAWPEGEIDHKDGDPSNDRWTNLRDVTHQMNRENQRVPRADNKLGVLGVTMNRCGGYLARIHTNGVTKCLGTYSTSQLASEAYLVAKRQLHKGGTL